MLLIRSESLIGRMMAAGYEVRVHLFIGLADLSLALPSLLNIAAGASLLKLKSN